MIKQLRIDGRAGFTLVEIMIVVAIIGLLAAIAVPSFIRARKRSQATTVLNELRQVDGAIDQYALENNKTSADTVTWANIQPYLKAGTRLYNSGNSDLLGNTFTISTVASGVKVNTNTRTAFSGVGISWGPY
ncbi:MAG: prepilin-type N-terminal cleavage/methylation domain-containing protein [Verrucomicrobiae bacterium]|nr:prepilin-type N-terminal cleavage/methylation domain-containing protein [Verrucomicrobiae bacterium]